MPATRGSLRYVLALLFLAGCAPTEHNSQIASTSSNPNFRERIVNVENLPSDGADKIVTRSDHSTVPPQLALLQQQRLRERRPADCPIGPGDLLDISVPDMEELADRVVRVSGEGTIS